MSLRISYNIDNGGGGGGEKQHNGECLGKMYPIAGSVSTLFAIACRTIHCAYSFGVSVSGIIESSNKS